MNLAKLKLYAPKARQDFIEAVTDRAAFYGLKQEGDSVAVLPIVEKGAGVVIGGQAFPRKVVQQRQALEERVRTHGFLQTMEALAYTWFNRLVAIRYMEIHGYFDHGYRVLSASPQHEGEQGERLPEILQQAEHVVLPALSQQAVIDLKLDGTKDAQLYKMLLLAQCHALHSTMPFIFSRIDDEAELLLPDNLLHSDSLIRKLVNEITDEDCTSVEILGWLYQFYISAKKDAVMARKSAVPTDDIPAVTQLFTPHWIVRYLVENSLGRLWLLNRPDSRLREQMPYYIEGEPETDFLKITKPEKIRMLDPAVGSGHMLTYSFDLLYAIYEEEGYSPSEIPGLILTHNLFGVDICPRAAQLAALALVLKAREKSRRFFQGDNLIQPKILALENVHFEEGELREYMRALNLGGLFDAPMLKLLHQFEEATTVGSLIQPCLNERAIAFARSAIEEKDLGGQLFLRATHVKVLLVLEQAEVLSPRYEVVISNPPYMGSKAMNGKLKLCVSKNYQDAKSDLMTCFMELCRCLVVKKGRLAMINLPSWLFLSAFEEFRRRFIKESTISSFLHLGRGMFGSDFGSVAFVIENSPPGEPRGSYRRLFKNQSEVASVDEIDERFRDAEYGAFTARQADFLGLPGCPIAYWISPAMKLVFESCEPLADLADSRIGMATGRNATYVRHWHEVAQANTGFGIDSRAAAKKSGKRWFPYAKGGEFRKWYGNLESVVDWSNDGHALQTTLHPGGERVWAHNFNLEQLFQPAICWTVVTIAETGFRSHPRGFVFDAAAGLCQPKSPADHSFLLGALNSKVASSALAIINPTVNLHPGYLGRVPIPDMPKDEIVSIVGRCLAIAKNDWDNFETSWDYRDQPLLRHGLKGEALETSWRNWAAECTASIHLMQHLETENNRLFIDACGLANELKPQVALEKITLARADARKDVAAFISYAVGCMMGRYSLDQPGLLLANAGDSLAAYAAKVGRTLDELTFEPDEDGIIPVLDYERFKDDIVARTREFLHATFGEATLAPNLRFIEESLGKDLRKYFLTDFYKDHRQTYRNRPIYWLFSSGKQRAFQCLVYLHRYNEGTLSRMRTEYVLPLQGQLASRIEQLEGDKITATSTSHRKKLQKEQDGLKKQQTELLGFDEKLKHAADQKVRLDLDDGVKVNYAKFGDLLADVTSVTGGDDE